MDLNAFIDKLRTGHRSQYNILEIGPSDKTVLSNLTQTNININTVDIENVENFHPQHIHYQLNFLNFSPDISYDLIIDKCVWHEQAPKNRSKYLNKIYSLLKEGGRFIGEHAIYHKNIEFEEMDLLYDHESKCLFQ